MSGSSRQKTLLIVLACLAAFTGWHYLRPLLGFGGSDEPAAAVRAPGAEPGEEGAAARSRSTRVSHTARPGDRVEVLKMASLDHVTTDDKVGRDPWRFVDPPPPPPPPKPLVRVPTPAELEAQRRAAELAAERARQVALEAAKPRPPEFTMEYLGNFGPPNRKIAVFSSGKQTINAMEGEVLEKDFIVAHIGYESVDIKYVKFPEVQPKRIGLRRH
jgi:hypothetical protein